MSDSYSGYAIVETHFPHLSPLLETYFLTCLLHDIGTTSENMKDSHMSFEYYGAFQALNFLKDSGSPKDQAEAVSEAIIRHADLGETGTLTSLGMIIQLSTVFGKSYDFLHAHCNLTTRGYNRPDRHTPRYSVPSSGCSAFPSKRITACTKV
jgi:cyanamide hydratase family protein with HD domain